MDTTEIVNGIADGVQLDVLKNMSLISVLRVVALILIGVIAIRVVLNLLERMLERSKSLVSLRTYIVSVARVLLYFLLCLVVASSMGIEVTSLIALLSVAGLAVSLALQNTLSNLAGGIMLLVAKPFQVGDFVEADGNSGTVQAIDLAYTTLTTGDNKKIYVPNSQISATKIINYTAMGCRRVDLSFTASYDAPTAAVKKAIQEVLDTLPQIQQDPAPVIYLTEYQASSIQYQVRLWTSCDDYWTVYFAIMEGVRESFARNNVEMTYDHLNVHLVEK